MLSLSNFFRGNRHSTWVLAGKGPSFATRPAAIPYPVLGLNHVCLKVPCALAHFTDLGAFLDCHNELCEGQAAVVLPWHPHVNNKPGKKNLEQLIGVYGGLEDLFMMKRLYTYNSTLARHRKDGLPTHRTRYFSAVVGLDILAAHGIETVLTLGIDGGADYSPEFDRATLLSNGRSSFDVQFGEMRKIAEKYLIDVKPLTEARP